MLTFITLPNGTIAGITAYIGELFTGAGALIWLAIGIPLAFYVIRKVISLVAARAR